MVINDKIEKALAVLPDKPGVYLMRDGTGRVLYVGKAKNLNNRVHSYFRASGRHSAKVVALTSHVDDLETILTDSEIEALILECNLIKKYRPRYNIMLKDDKTYPYLKVTCRMSSLVCSSRAASCGTAPATTGPILMWGPCGRPCGCCARCSPSVSAAA